MANGLPSELPVFELNGTPEEIGSQHGLLAAGQLAEAVESRMKLCRDFVPGDGRKKSDSEIRALAERCFQAHAGFSPDLMLELRATAHAAGFLESDLLIYNGFTDFKDLLFAEASCEPGGCTTFAVSPQASADGTGWIGQTWDMYSSALPYVCILMLRPKGKPAAVMVSLAGCVGMFGINEEGLAVCTNNLHARRGRIGVFWPFVMRKLLEYRTLAGAEECLTRATVAGGHNFLLMGPPGDAIAEWEIQPFSRTRLPTRDWTCHTNHCTAPATAQEERVDSLIARQSSEERFAQAAGFLQNHAPSIRPDDLFALTRLQPQGTPHGVCMQPVPGYDVQTCAAAVMQPSSRSMWVIKGRPCNGEYHRVRS